MSNLTKTASCLAFPRTQEESEAFRVATYAIAFLRHGFKFRSINTKGWRDLKFGFWKKPRRDPLANPAHFHVGCTKGADVHDHRADRS